MTDLSPATQTVLDAFLNGYICNPGYNVAFESDRNGLAAALRAVADRVAPSDADEPRNNLPMAIECRRIRKELLDIAAELEAQ